MLAVNQQLRFDEGIAAAYAMVRRGWIGAVSALSITVDIWTAWSDWPWLLPRPQLEISHHSIHYHDVVRWFLGEPEAVFCAGGPTDQGQAAAGETRTVSTYRYPGDVIAVVHANHMNDHGDAAGRVPDRRAPKAHSAAPWACCTTTRRGRPDTLEMTSRPLGTNGWLSYPVTTAGSPTLSSDRWPRCSRPSQVAAAPIVCPGQSRNPAARPGALLVARHRRCGAARQVTGIPRALPAPSL